MSGLGIEGPFCLGRATKQTAKPWHTGNFRVHLCATSAVGSCIVGPCFEQLDHVWNQKFPCWTLMAPNGHQANDFNVGSRSAGSLFGRLI